MAIRVGSGSGPPVRVQIGAGAAGGARLYLTPSGGGTPPPPPPPPDPPPPPPPPGTRDPLIQPFASTSIWNMPIGSNAVYVDAQMLANPRNDPWMDRPYRDPMRICMTPTAPMTQVRYSDAGWGGNRCNATGTPSQYATNPVATVPMPTNWTVASSGDNGCCAFLMPNGRTIIQMQPYARCVAGSFGTAQIKLPGFIGDSNPDQDLYTTGYLGSQGASRLSALGGTLRMGEMRPADGLIGPRHALKIIIDSQCNLYNASVKADTFRWPAIASDSIAVSAYGSIISGPFCMKMGSLLCLPDFVSIAGLGLETQPGKQIAWTLQNYGAYIVDQTGGGGFALATEEGAHGSFINQFASDWGYSFQMRVRDDLPWTRDWGKILVQLHVVDNNGPSSIGGGGTPLQPLAPSIGPGP